MMTSEQKAEQSALQNCAEIQHRHIIGRQSQTPAVPTKREELSTLPEYTGTDCVRIHSEHRSPIYWKDDGSLWRLVQRPDGESCKANARLRGEKCFA